MKHLKRDGKEDERSSLESAGEKAAPGDMRILGPLRSTGLCNLVVGQRWLPSLSYSSLDPRVGLIPSSGIWIDPSQDITLHLVVSPWAPLGSDSFSDFP